VLWSLPVNRFTVLEIEDINISDNEPKNIYSSIPVSYLTPQRPKWKRQLPKKLATNILDIYRMSLVLIMKLSIINTSKLYSINALLDYRATRNFIDHDFVHSKGINTWTISHSILIFNINRSPNEASQILEVIDIVLYYKTHSE